MITIKKYKSSHDNKLLLDYVIEAHSNQLYTNILYDNDHKQEFWIKSKSSNGYVLTHIYRMWLSSDSNHIIVNDDASRCLTINRETYNKFIIDIEDIIKTPMSEVTNGYIDYIN